MAEIPPINSRMMVKGEVERAPEDEVQIKKTVCLIGHSFVRRLRDHVDCSPGLDRDFGLDSVRVEWLGLEA